MGGEPRREGETETEAFMRTQQKFLAEMFARSHEYVTREGFVPNMQAELAKGDNLKHMLQARANAGLGLGYLALPTQTSRALSVDVSG